MSVAAPPLTVGVPSSPERERPRRLLAALEEAFPVRFEGRQKGELRGLDAVLELGDEGQAEAASASGIPALSLLVPEPAEPGAAVANALSSDSQLDRRLRDAVLPDAHLGAALDSSADLAASGQAGVLASCRGRPTWV
ncbi:MAG: hypothetical protein WA862_08195, partial [Solirubrobacterales bacterium]